MSTLELLREFQELGCKDQSKTALACRVYQNLQLSKKYTNIDKAYNEDLDIIYILGYENDMKHVFLPLISTQTLEMFELERIQSKLKELYTQCTIHFAICDTASNVLFYTMTAGFLDNEVHVPRKR